MVVSPRVEVTRDGPSQKSDQRSGTTPLLTWLSPIMLHIFNKLVLIGSQTKVQSEWFTFLFLFFEISEVRKRDLLNCLTLCQEPPLSNIRLVSRRYWSTGWSLLRVCVNWTVKTARTSANLRQIVHAQLHSIHTNAPEENDRVFLRTGSAPCIYVGFN